MRIERPLKRMYEAVAAVCGLVVSAAGVSAECAPAWQGGYELPGINGMVYASVMFDDDGAGPHAPALYVGGSFDVAGGEHAVGVARWNGTMWEPVGHEGFYNGPFTPGGVGVVRSLAVFNGELYAGGEFFWVGSTFVDNLAKFDGTNWVALTAGGVLELNGCCAPPVINAMTVYNDGTGDALYITGRFDFAGDLFNTGIFVQANSIVKYDGTAYSPLGPEYEENGLQWAEQARQGLALAVYNGQLYVTGDFAVAGSASNTGGIARWNGTTWSSVGTIQLDGSRNVGNTLLVMDEDGTGPLSPVLVLGGRFTKVGVGFSGSPGVDAKSVAKFNGTIWSAYGAGLLFGGSATPAQVQALASFDNGSGPRLYAAGLPIGNGTMPTDLIKRWNGSVWEDVTGGPLRGVSVAVAQGISGVVNNLISADLDGGGPQGTSLVAMGLFDAAGSSPAVNIAKYNGTAWSPIPAGEGLWSSPGSRSGTGIMLGLAAGDEDGAGARPISLYSFGTSINAGDTLTPGGIARLDGATWTQLGTVSGNNPGGPGFKILTLLFHNDGSGQKLYAVGGGGVRRWDGTAWSAYAPGRGSISCAALFDDDGAGPHAPVFCIGGIYVPDQPDPELPPNPTESVSMWNGSAWVSLLSANPNAPRPYSIASLITYNSQLYAGGFFLSSSDSPFSVGGLGRWDGTNWNLVLTDLFVSGGGQNSYPHSVKTMAVFNNKLYVGGDFSSIGGASSPGIAAFDGTTWTSVGDGVTAVDEGGSHNGYPYVDSLGVGNDGTGSALFVGGKFDMAGGVPNTKSIAKWNGSAFSALGTGITLNSVRGPDAGGPVNEATGTVNAIASVNGSVYFAGNFNKAGGTTSYSFAQWKGGNCCPADFNGDSVRDVADLFGYINAWLAKTPSADFNHDTLVDVADLFGFINAWLAGC